MAPAKLENGEQYLIQTVDKRLALTTHRLILRHLPWTPFGYSAVKLEDIQGWEVKPTSKNLYFILSVLMALMVYFNDSFALLSSFFLMLFLMTRHRCVHVKTHDKVMVLPLEVDETRIKNLVDMVKRAKHSRQFQILNKTAA